MILPGEGTQLGLVEPLSMPRRRHSWPVTRGWKRLTSCKAHEYDGGSLRTTETVGRTSVVLIIDLGYPSRSKMRGAGCWERIITS